MYNFADGNGNLYIITTKTIEYKPISPSLSSSGIYSGGEYLEKEITTNQYNRVKDKINNAVLNESIHIENRLKGSGMITIIEENNKKTRYLIKSGSEELLQLEDLLIHILKIK